MIVKTNYSRSTSIRFVLHFEHVAIVFCRGPPTFVLEKLLSCVKIALVANRVFFKTLSRNIYTRFMITGSGQGVIKRKKKLLTLCICG